MNTKFVAEVSSNHHQSLERSQAFIKAAAQIGCHSVKFQLFKIDELFTPQVLAANSQIAARRQWELPVSFLKPLADYSHALGLEFSCTPFYLEAVEELLPYVDYFKIASYELLWLDLFRACSATGKPLVFSTGMATIPEIKAALATIAQGKTKTVTVLHCTSSYPTPLPQVNLRALETLRGELKEFSSTFDLRFGLSDHSVSPAVISRAIHKYEVALVEFHLDLDGTGDEFKTGHCWLPEAMKRVIVAIKDGEIADGPGGKLPMPNEMDERLWRADPRDGLRPLQEKRNALYHA